MRRVKGDIAACFLCLALDDHQVDLGTLLAAIEAQGCEVTPFG